MATVGELAYVITVRDQGVQQTISGADRAMAQAATNIEGHGNRIQSTLSKVFAGAVIFRFVRDTVQAGAAYQQAMNQFQAASGATGDQMAKASKIALQLGNDVQLPAASAKDAGDAMEILAKGGLSASDSMAAAHGTLLLAAAAGIDTAQAATITAQALNTFGLEGSAASSVANVLAGAANASTGEMSDFANGLQDVGATARGLGIDMNDSTTALAAMAQQGLRANVSGTSLKNMLMSLASPTKQQAAALEELGVKAFDANGKFVGLEVVSGQLAAAHANLSQQAWSSATAIAFGADGANAAGALAMTGAQGFATLEEKITAAGNAAKLAEAKSKGMQGALAALSSTVETMQLQLFLSQGTELEGVVRDITDALPEMTSSFLEIGGAAGQGAVLGLRLFLTTAQGLAPVISLGAELLGWIADLPAPIQTAAIAMLLLSRNSSGITSIAGRFSELRNQAVALGTVGATGIGDIGRAFVAARTSGEGFAASAKTSLSGVGSAAKGAGSALMGALGGPLGLAIAGVGVALSAVADRNAEAAQQTREHAAAAQSLAAALKESNGELNDNVLATAKKNLEDSGMLDLAKKAGVSQKDLILAYAEGGAELDKMVEKLNKAKDANKEFWTTQSGYNEKGTAARDLAKWLADDSDAMGKAKEANEALDEAQGETTGGMNETSDAAQDAADSVNDLKDAFDQLNGGAVDLVDAQASMTIGLSDMADAIAANGTSLDLSTESGAKNAQMLKDLAQTGTDVATATYQQTGSIDAAKAAFESQRQSIIDNAAALGLNKDQVIALLDQIMQMPPEVSIKVTENSVEVMTALDALNIKTTTLSDGSIAISDNSPETVAKLAALNLKTTTLSDGTIVITDNSGKVITNLSNVNVKTVTLENGDVVITDNAGTVIAHLDSIDAKQIQDKSYTITTWFKENHEVTYTGGSGYAGPMNSTSGLRDMALGGVFSAGLQYMAGGGVPDRIGGIPISQRAVSRRLASGAGIIAGSTNKLMPNGRVTGDRVGTDELYAPIDGSPRFWSLLGEGARRGGGVAMPAQRYAAQLAGAAAAGAAAAGTNVTRAGDVNYGGFTINTPEAAPDAVIAALDRREWLRGGRTGT